VKGAFFRNNPTFESMTGAAKAGEAVTDERRRRSLAGHNGEEHMPSSHDCCLCSQIAGDPHNDLIAKLLPDSPYIRRIMLEDAVFAVMPSLGPLVPGHSLLCPKAHVRSFAALDHHLHDTYAQMKAALCHRLRERHGGGIHLFEHGMASGGDRVVCTVEHAHMHFVPLPADFDAGLADGWIAFDGSLDVLRELSGGAEYVLYEGPAGTAYLLKPGARGIESQHMRRLIAEALAPGKHWNWRTAPDAPSADQTWRGFVSS
jgi:diadenosine tetraphosphate (Ap4A) HIT family hydrolase